MKFKELGLHQNVIEALDTMGFENPTEIQVKAIPPVMKGSDIIACAQTGTGKTAAFLLPILDNILNQPQEDSIKALIISPTRELAQQIDQQLQGLAYFSGISSLAVYGGGSGSEFDVEKRALTEGADIIVCTPGRLISHLNMGYVKFGHLRFLVLDEADRMLDMGFNQDIVRINSFLPKKKQTLMFSATMPPKIRALAKTVLNEPVEVSVAISQAASGIFQGVFMISKGHKIPLIQHLLSAKKLQSVLIFGSTINDVKNIYKALKIPGYVTASVHSGLEQKEREEILRKFKNREVNVIVATDVLARGIDIVGIDLVINYDVPSDPEDYIHRIGRTARAKATGVAFTLVDKEQKRKFERINSFVKNKIQVCKIPANLNA